MTSRRVRIGIVLACIYALGVLVRVQYLPDWLQQPGPLRFQDQPLFTNVDGYFYLDLARDLLEGGYDARDPHRGAPDSTPRPAPPPLLSCLTAAIAHTASLSPAWVALWLPALLGPLLAFPLYALGRELGGAVAGLTAALFAVLGRIYVARTELGWFDTDCLIVPLAFGLTYVFLRFGAEQGRRRYGYAAAGLGLFLVFLLWWDQTPSSVVVLALYPLLISLSLHYRPPPREGLAFLGVAAVMALLVTLWIQAYSSAPSLYHRLAEYFLDRGGEGGFPNVGLGISELRAIDINVLSALSFSHPALFLAALIGLVWLVLDRAGQSLYLLPYGLLAGLSLVLGARFSLFAVPVLALGLGYLAQDLWNRRHRFRPLSVLVPVAVAGAAAVPLAAAVDDHPVPVIDAAMVQGLDAIRTHTPPDAIIWGYWHDGYPIQYWARRATLGDGALHGRELAVYQSLPFGAADPRLAANFIRFFAARGLLGVREFYTRIGTPPERGGLSMLKALLAGGPERLPELLPGYSGATHGSRFTLADWAAFLFPAPRRPVYLYLNRNFARVTERWYAYATWDPRAGAGQTVRFRLLTGLRQQGGALVADEGVAVDRVAGTVRIKAGAATERVPLRELVEYADGTRRTTGYAAAGRLVLHYNPGTGVAALMDQALADSVFIRMFLAERGDAFVPVLLNAPEYQLWAVPEPAPDSGRG